MVSVDSRNEFSKRRLISNNIFISEHSNMETISEITHLYDIFVRKEIQIIEKDLNEVALFDIKSKIEIFLLFSIIWNDGSLSKKLESYITHYNLNIKIPKISDKLYTQINNGIIEILKHKEIKLFKEIMKNQKILEYLNEDFLICISPFLTPQSAIWITNSNFKILQPRDSKSIFRGIREKPLNVSNFFKVLCRRNLKSENLIVLAKFFQFKIEIPKAFIRYNKNREFFIVFFSNNENRKQFCLMAAKYGNFYFLNFNLQYLKTEYFQNESQIFAQNVLLNFMKNFKYIDLKLYIIFLFCDYLLCQDAESFIYNISNSIVSLDPSDNLLFSVGNPVKTFIYIIKICTKIIIQFPNLEVKANKLMQKCSKMSLQIFTNNNDSEQCKYILEDKTFEGRSVIDEYDIFNTYKCLKSPSIHQYIIKKWEGYYSHNPLFYTCSYTYKFIQNKFNNEFPTRRNYCLKHERQLRGSFLDFMHSPQTKFYYQLLFEITFVIIMYIFLDLFINRLNTITATESNLETSYSGYLKCKNSGILCTDQFNSLANSFADQMNGALYFAYAFCFLECSLIAEIVSYFILLVFGGTTDSELSWFSILNFLRIITFGLNGCLIVLLVKGENQSLEGNIIYPNQGVKIYLKYYYYMNNYFLQLIAALMGLAIFRLFFILRTIKGFGVKISAIIDLSDYVLKFLLLFLLLLVAMSCIGTISFGESETKNYSTMMDSIFTYLAIACNKFAITDYDSLDSVVVQQIGKISLLVWNFLTKILLFNILICVINFLYPKYDEHSTEIMLISQFRVSKHLAYDKKYGHLKSGFFILNSLFLFLFPFTFISPRLINYIFILIEYLPIVCINIIVHLLINSILTFFASLKFFGNTIYYLLKYLNSKFHPLITYNPLIFIPLLICVFIYSLFFLLILFFLNFYNCYEMIIELFKERQSVEEINWSLIQPHDEIVKILIKYLKSRAKENIIIEKEDALIDLTNYIKIQGYDNFVGVTSPVNKSKNSKFDFIYLIKAFRVFSIQRLESKIYTKTIRDIYLSEKLANKKILINIKEEKQLKPIQFKYFERIDHSVLYDSIQSTN